MFTGICVKVKCLFLLDLFSIVSGILDTYSIDSLIHQWMTANWHST